MEILNTPQVSAIRIGARIQNTRKSPVYVVWGLNGGGFEAAWRIYGKHDYDALEYMKDPAEQWRLLGVYDRDVTVSDLAEDVEAWLLEHGRMYG